MAAVRWGVSVTIVLWVTSCAALVPSAGVGVMEMRTDSYDNGHVVEFVADRPVGAVSALVTRGRWLVVTIVDTLLETSELEMFRSSVVDTVEITRFPTALQVACHLTFRPDGFEVVHTDPSPSVVISLFTARKKRGP